MLNSAAEKFIYHLNQKWPDRNMSNDLVSDQEVIFDPDLDGKKTTTKVFIQELLFCVKNNLDKERILAIVYENKKASSEQKNSFWSWQESDIRDSLIHIYFNDLNSNNASTFNFPIFEKSKKIKKKTIDFPGIKSLQYKRKNRHVKTLQNKLNEKGFFVSEKELGYYGKETCEAVKLYYRRVLGIKSDTIIKDGKKFGPKAWERLFS
jgi:hypothetical protein